MHVKKPEFPRFVLEYHPRFPRITSRLTYQWPGPSTSPGPAQALRSAVGGRVTQVPPSTSVAPKTTGETCRKVDPARPPVNARRTWLHGNNAGCFRLCAFMNFAHFRGHLAIRPSTYQTPVYQKNKINSKPKVFLQGTALAYPGTEAMAFNGFLW